MELHLIFVEKHVGKGLEEEGEDRMKKKPQYRWGQAGLQF
jgi:hypothetical protein